MTECEHKNEWLMGNADGIVCRRCGAVFKSFDELKPDAPVEEPKAKRTRKKKEV